MRQTVYFNSDHYNVFKYCLKTTAKQSVIGKIASQWYVNVTGDKSNNLNLSDKKLSRDQLQSLCKNQNISDFVCLVSIMSWGAQSVSNARHFMCSNKDALSKILKIVHNMRCGNLNSYDAYYQFHLLRKSNELKGMGIAYYTKLIYFCCHDDDALILDQWLAKSINLLVKSKMIILNDIGRVTDDNGVNHYKNYVSVVRQIADYENVSIDAIEVALFSSRTGIWRRYLKSVNEIENINNMISGDTND